MKITESMNLSVLAQFMGPDAQPAEAAAMRNILVDFFGGEDTRDILEGTWLYFVAYAAENPQPLPDGLTCESALDAVRDEQPCTDMAVRELRRILDEVVDWGTPAAEDLRDDCRRYLEELEA